MKIKLGELEEILTGLSSVQYQLPVKTAYWLGIFKRKAKQHYDEYSDRRREMVEKYGEKDGEGKFIVVGQNSVKLKDIEGYNKEVKELNDVEIDIPFRPMALTDFFPVKKGKEGKEEESLIAISTMEVLSRFIIPLPLNEKETTP
jgi:hypothetical protein